MILFAGTRPTTDDENSRARINHVGSWWKGDREMQPHVQLHNATREMQEKRLANGHERNIGQCLALIDLSLDLYAQDTVARVIVSFRLTVSPIVRL